MWIRLPRGVTAGQFIDSVENYVSEHLDGDADYTFEYANPGYNFSTTNQELDAFVEAHFTDLELNALMK